MQVSKVTSKFQATIPLEIRNFLKLYKGDGVGFDIEDNKVVIKRVPPKDIAYLKSVELTLSEWNSEEDDELFRHLQ